MKIGNATYIAHIYLVSYGEPQVLCNPFCASCNDVVLLDCPQICIFLLEAHVSLLFLKVFYLTCHKDNKDISNWL